MMNCNIAIQKFRTKTLLFALGTVLSIEQTSNKLTIISVLGGFRSFSINPRAKAHHGKKIAWFMDRTIEWGLGGWTVEHSHS